MLDAFEPVAAYCAARLTEDPHLWASILFYDEHQVNGPGRGGKRRPETYPSVV